MRVRFNVRRLCLLVLCCVALGVVQACVTDPPPSELEPMQQPEPEPEPMDTSEDVADGDSAAPEEAGGYGAPAMNRGLGESGVDGSTDLSGRLNDPRFPDTPDNGPESWPAWRPTHRIEFIEVPTSDGSTIEFNRSGGRKLVYGEVYQEGDKVEIRFKLFENGKRIQFDRTRCTWRESADTLELGCRSSSNEIARIHYSIVRTERGWTLKQTARSQREVRFAPRQIVAEML